MSLLGVTILAGCSTMEHPVPNGPINLEQIATASILTREAIGGQSEFVTGSSMLPIFSSNTMLLHVHSWPVKPGQLVVIKWQGKKYFHQVIATDGDDRFLTKGINNQSPDPWLSRENYIGTVYWAGWFG